MIMKQAFTARVFQKGNWFVAQFETVASSLFPVPYPYQNYEIVPEQENI